MNAQETKRLQTLFLHVAKEYGLPNYKEVAIRVYSEVIEDLSVVFSRDRKEAVFVHKTKKGDLVATSAKIGNFRFRIRDFLIHVLEGSVSIGTTDSSFVYYYILKLLIKLMRLSFVSLDKGEIDVLMLVHSAFKRGQKLTVDQVYETLSKEWTPAEISEALDNLHDKLHCIEIDDNYVIEPIEAIVFNPLSR